MNSLSYCANARIIRKGRSLVHVLMHNQYSIMSYQKCYLKYGNYLLPFSEILEYALYAYSQKTCLDIFLKWEHSLCSPDLISFQDIQFPLMVLMSLCVFIATFHLFLVSKNLGQEAIRGEFVLFISTVLLNYLCCLKEVFPFNLYVSSGC